MYHSGNTSSPIGDLSDCLASADVSVSDEGGVISLSAYMEEPFKASQEMCFLCRDIIIVCFRHGLRAALMQWPSAGIRTTRELGVIIVIKQNDGIQKRSSPTHALYPRRKVFILFKKQLNLTPSTLCLALPRSRERSLPASLSCSPTLQLHLRARQSSFADLSPIPCL